MTLNYYSTTFGVPFQAGNWNGVKDKFIGLRIKIDSNWHYGWARLDVDSLAQYFTIKNYANNSVKDEMIYAGIGNTVIEENKSIPDVFVYEKNKKLYIDFKNSEIENYTVKFIH